MRTLHARLLLCTALPMGMVLSAFAFTQYAVVRSALSREFDESLLSKARAMAALAERDGETVEIEPPGTPANEFPPSEQAEYFEFRAASGEVLAQSGPLTGDEFGMIGNVIEAPVFLDLALPDGRPARLVAITFKPRDESAPDRAATVADQSVRLIVTRETSAMDQTLGRIRLLMLLGCVVALLVMVVVLSWSVQRGIIPLNRVASQIAGIGESALSTRIDSGGVPAELTPIVLRLNELLARIEAAFAREKAFTADVAHELRTPLAGLRTTLEVAASRDRDAEAYKKAIADSLGICTQMQHMVHNLLELARADSDSLCLSRETVDLAELLHRNWAPFESRAAARHLRVAWRLPQACPVVIDPTKVDLIAANLFDNVCAYADSGGQVEIALTGTDGRIVICIENTGSSISRGDVGRVFDRFWRSDTARTEGDRRRYGLGLALCRKLADRLGGSIAADVTNENRFVIVIVLPTNPDLAPN